jgi:hypothetical protein
MPEIGMSGSMSGVGKRSLRATASNLDSTERDGRLLYKEFFIIRKTTNWPERRGKKPRSDISGQ